MIRTGFIYQPAHVSLVGTSKILTNSAAFANAREPLAQAFKAKNGPSDTFVVIANHFKSKGSGPNSGENADRAVESSLPTVPQTPTPGRQRAWQTEAT